MRWSAASTFLQSRVGRRLFAAFFVLVAVLVGAVSLLAYQLTDYIVRQSASQLSSEMTKAVGINLIDRLRAAESLLRIHAQSLAAGTPPTALSERMAVVFSNVRVEASASVLPAGKGALASLRVQDGDVPDTPPAVELVVPMEPWRVHGTLNAEYLWENAQSGTHRICFSGAGFARPYCQGVQETGAAVIRSASRVADGRAFGGGGLARLRQQLRRGLAAEQGGLRAARTPRGGRNRAERNARGRDPAAFHRHCGGHADHRQVHRQPRAVLDIGGAEAAVAARRDADRGQDFVARHDGAAGADEERVKQDNAFARRTG